MENHRNKKIKFLRPVRGADARVVRRRLAAGPLRASDASRGRAQDAVRRQLRARAEDAARLPAAAGGDAAGGTLQFGGEARAGPGRDRDGRSLSQTTR